MSLTELVFYSEGELSIECGYKEKR
jgi:hypothetical protein